MKKETSWHKLFWKQIVIDLSGFPKKIEEKIVATWRRIARDTGDIVEYDSNRKKWTIYLHPKRTVSTTMTIYHKGKRYVWEL